MVHQVKLLRVISKDLCEINTRLQIAFPQERAMPPGHK